MSASAGPEIIARVERFPVRGTWSISRASVSEIDVVVAEARFDGAVGRGECRPYARYGWTTESVIAEIEAAAPAIAALPVPQDWDLGALLPANAARNALDCALWDLRAKLEGRPVWELAGLARAPEPVVTAMSLSLDTPEAMAARATELADQPLLKVKLGGAGAADLARLRAIREAAPRPRLIVDANEGWDADVYAALAPALVEIGVEMVEQPLPEGADGALKQLARPLAVCADESCHDRATLPALAGTYDMVNIKLDKTGGLTEALALKAEAEAAGFAVMVGCMVGSSLAMAPAVLVAQGAAIADLDGPLILAEDRSPGLRYDAGRVHPPVSALWG